MKYKCIPAPEEIKIDKSGDLTERIANKERAVRSFADLINKESIIWLEISFNGKYFNNRRTWMFFCLIWREKRNNILQYACFFQ